ncbi:MAG TPA: EF-hand domain-containing protein [Burkholderiaceae bacterium]|jgi:hypothetical protein
MISAIASNSTNAASSAQHKRPSLEDAFKKMDSDGDGSVSQQEFESAFVAISQKGGQAADSASSADLKAKADAEFKKMDSDGDGKVSQTEFSTAAKAHEAEHAQGAQGTHKGGHGGHHGGGGEGGGEGGASAASSSAAKTYDPADTNKDGVVSAQEEAAYQVTQQAQEAVKTYSGVEAAN